MSTELIERIVTKENEFQDVPAMSQSPGNCAGCNGSSSKPSPAFAADETSDLAESVAEFLKSL